MARRMTRMNFATVIGTITPLNAPNAPDASFRADTTLEEESILGEPQIAKPRGTRHMSHDGENSTVIDRYSRAGTRDLILMDGTNQAEALIYYAYQNPMVHFDFEFQYRLDHSDPGSARIQRHRSCFIENQPGREVNNEILVVRFTLNYHSLEILDATTGELVDGKDPAIVAA